MPDQSCLVVGAGPVGLAAACLLRSHELQVTIVDMLDSPVIQTKAAGIWSRTTEVLDSLDLAERFVEAGLRCYGTNIHVGTQRIAHIGLESIESTFNFVLMLAQDQTERLLNQRLEELGVTVTRGKTLQSLEQDEHAVEAKFSDGEHACYHWLIGCDGAHSTVRHLLGLEFLGSKEPHQWIVADLTMRGLSTKDEIAAYLHADGPLALFPLGNDLYRAVGEIAASDTSQSPETSLAQTIYNRVPDQVQIESIHHAGYFEIHERQAPQYRVGRVFLAGDAAHVHSPLGGQGMNTGLQDVHNLAWKLGLVEKGLASPDLLDSYQQERHPVAAGVLRATAFGTHVLTLRSPVARHLRGSLLKVVTNLPPARSKARSTLSELNIHYRDSSLTQSQTRLVPAWAFGKGVPPGDRAPDGTVVDPSGESDRLLTRLRAHAFLLLVFHGPSEASDELEPFRRCVFPHLPSTIRRVEISAHSNREAAFDPEGELHHQYAATHPCYYLVRPDGYVALRETIDRPQLLLDWISRWLPPGAGKG